MQGITGIIAEYNPFHKGHAYQIEMARKLTKNSYILVIMSGDFVQRGAPAIFDKYSRANMALLGGADAVLELPAFWSCASAEYFARGAAAILDALGCVSHLCFGSESGDALSCQKLGQLLAREPEDFQRSLKNHVKKGLSFPAARKKALIEYLESDKGDSIPAEAFPQGIQNLLDAPNNLLGIEYCKALALENSPILPVTIQRKGAGYHDTDLSQTFASASAIRKALNTSKSTQESPSQLLLQSQPKAVAAFTQKLLTEEDTVTEEDFSLLLKYQLLQHGPEDLTRFTDVSPSLAQRICRELNSFSSFSQFTSLLKTREMTYTRISRALLHILLGITQEEMPEAPSYVRLLGFRREKGALLRQIQDNSRIPLVTKAADYRKLLPKASWKSFEKDLFCANLYESVKAEKSQKPFVNDLQRSPVIL